MGNDYETVMSDRELLEHVAATLDRFTALADRIEAELPQAQAMMESLSANPMFSLLGFKRGR